MTEHTTDLTEDYGIKLLMKSIILAVVTGIVISPLAFPFDPPIDGVWSTEVRFCDTSESISIANMMDTQSSNNRSGIKVSNRGYYWSRKNTTQYSNLVWADTDDGQWRIIFAVLSRDRIQLLDALESGSSRTIDSSSAIRSQQSNMRLGDTESLRLGITLTRCT